MSQKSIGWAVGLAFVLWYYLKKVAAAAALMVRYLLPQNIRISKGAVMWNQPVVITNPTDTPISLQRYNIRIDLESYPVGTAYGNISTVLNAGSDTTIMALVVVPLDALLTSLPDLLNAGKSIDFRFVGTITAELFTIPVDTKIGVPIPKI
jgi:LEA14-like dessication related protein